MNPLLRLGLLVIALYTGGPAWAQPPGVTPAQAANRDAFVERLEQRRFDRRQQRRVNAPLRSSVGAELDDAQLQRRLYHLAPADRQRLRQQLTVERNPAGGRR